MINENEFKHRHLDDVKRIQLVLKNNGYNKSLDECANIWEDYSDMYCAGWLGLEPNDNDLFDVLKRYKDLIL